MPDKDDRIESTSLVEFFKDRVHEAIQNQKVRAPEGVEFYLVTLLKDYLKEEPRQEVLALLLGEALSADFHSRVTLFKRIGDLSLFTAGFFPASLQRQLVDIDYYVQMGGSAYGSLAQLLSRHSAFEEIYGELARRFVSYVDVLSEVSEKTDLLSPADLLRIYETWLKTGSERAKLKLAQEGIIPVPAVTRKPQ